MYFPSIMSIVKLLVMMMMMIVVVMMMVMILMINNEDEDKHTGKDNIGNYVSDNDGDDR